MNTHPNTTTTVDITHRIEELRRRTGLTYTELAQEIGIGRTTLHKMRKGENISQKLTGRLTDAEERYQTQSHTENPFPKTPAFLQLLTFLSEPALEEQWPIRLTPTYRCPKPEFPNEIEIEPPPIGHAINWVLHAIATDDYEPLVIRCLPKKYATKRFVNNLTAVCYINLTQACLRSIFGKNWRDEINALTKTGSTPQTSDNPAYAAPAIAAMAGATKHN